MATRYDPAGVDAPFEPGSRRRVLRNLLGITRVRDMNLAESQALELAQEAAIDRFGPEHRFTAVDICALHRLWSARPPGGIPVKLPGPAELGPYLARAAVGRLHLRLRGGRRPVATRAIRRCSV